jgi:hypothetical protein
MRGTRVSKEQGVPMVQTVPKCPEHKLALQLIRVEIEKDKDKIVTDVYGCPSPGL